MTARLQELYVINPREVVKPLPTKGYDGKNSIWLIIFEDSAIGMEKQPVKVCMD